MQIVGDRLAAALALGRERQKLTERAALLDRLTTFATVLVSSLDPDDDGRPGGDRREPRHPGRHGRPRRPSTSASGEFVIAAVSGGDRMVIGETIKPGEGISGRAISSRSVVVDDHLERSRYPKSVANARVPDALAAMSAPMVIGDEVVGAVTWLRGDLTKAVHRRRSRRSPRLLAGKVGLALANARAPPADRRTRRSRTR